MTGTPATPLSVAIAHHQRGELDRAAHLYQEILSKEPNHADALHLLGVLALQRGQVKQAIALIERAIALQPSAAVFHGNLAEAYRACGQVQRAMACCQIALRLEPASPDVAVTLGSLYMQVGRPAEAVTMFRHALKHRPDSAVAYNNLGNAYHVQGDDQQALANFRRAVELNPQLGFAHGNLGQLLLESNRPEEALHHCQEAVRLQPQSAPARNNLGNVLRYLGRREEAKACYTESLRMMPNLAMAYHNLGEAMQEENQLEQALHWFQQALQLEPNTARFRIALAGVLSEKQDFATAETHLHAVLQQDPRNLQAQIGLARLRQEQGRLEEAVTAYRALVKAHPNLPGLNCTLAEVLLELNHQEEALGYFRAALRIDPRHATALAHLATHLRDKLPAEEQDALHQLLAHPGLADHDRARLLFGLAQVCDARGRFNEAAEHLARANSLELVSRQQRGQGYNHEAHVHFVDRLLTVFNATFFDRVRGFGVDSERPIFIVGLPRSGTTLLEQVLASHPRVFGAGELRLSRQSFESLGSGANGLSESRAFDILETIDAEAVRRLAGAHLDKLAALNSTAERIIDKMPDNYMYLGFLAMQFPKARFLHCRRDLRDVAVSCWITQFRQIPWANDPEHMAGRFAQYQRIMAHWQRVLPVPVLDVDYEDMVEDLETVARRALDFCGLEWEPACLDFHRSRRPVRTASVTQVRQPIYRRSLARWRNYEKSLQPLFTRLGFANDAATNSQQEEVLAEVGAV